jgi:hypothetical protein
VTVERLRAVYVEDVTRAIVLGMLVGVLPGLTGCASSHTAAPVTHPAVVSPVAVQHPAIPPDNPPSPATWPKYPRFSQHSCWARPFLKGEIPKVESVAPSYATAPPAHPLSPQEVAKRLLSRLGDRRYVHSITFTPAPKAVGSNVHVLYAGGHPPADAVKATIVDPAANEAGRHSPSQTLTTGLAGFEGEIIGGALRDDLCDNGGAPLVMWGTNSGGGFAESGFALDQRFPNPTPNAFRERVALVGRRFGFRVGTLLLLRPRQIAPALIVETSRPRKEFVKDVPRIMDLLNPRTTAGKRTAQTFEAFFFAAEDAKGPFLFTEGFSRGEQGGGEWAANPCLYPYPVLGPVLRHGGKACT